MTAGPATTTTTATSRVRRLSERALIVRLDGRIPPARWAAADPILALPGLVEAVPGGASVMLRFADRRTADLAGASIPGIGVTAALTVQQRVHTLDVVYDGDDLDPCAQLLGRSTAALIRAHSSQEWECAFVGFAPGFAYLRASAQALTVPRRSEPRTVVPAGSVAMAGAYSAVYPRSSPGGWQLIGRTSRRLWNPADEAAPALIAPGDRVRFRPVRDQIRAAAADAHPARTATRVEGTALRVDDPGLLAVVTDLGRPGWVKWGVSRSGAMDRAAHRAANRLVGNEPGDATLEIVPGAGSRITAVGDLVIAVTGAHGDLGVTDAHGRVSSIRASAPALLPDAARLSLGPQPTGVRTYLAVRGGIDVPAVLGSRSTDTLGALGRTPIRHGELVGVGGRPPHQVVGMPESGPSYPSAEEVVDIAVTLGPDDDVFDDDQIEAFLEADWAVTAQSDRVGMRLTGAGIRRRDPSHEIESQGLVRGAIQVPAHGQPIIFQADHPVTGGYPVIAVVADADLDVVAQAPPGTRLRFATQRPRGTGAS